MHVIRARNVHTILPLGLRYLYSVQQPIQSRVGEALTAPLPVTSIYERPTERVIFWPERDAHPWFHFFEALWMLAGRDDLAYVQNFVGRMADYSDNGRSLHGAYGYRWRYHFGFDQIKLIINLLTRDPFSRRAVLQMWDPSDDLDSESKDLPCNISIMFRVAYGKRDAPNQLLTTVINRSNDILYGLYGANAVHMSMLAEYIASSLGLVVGPLTTVSNNFHAYTDVFNRVYRGGLLPQATDAVEAGCPYTRSDVAPYPLMASSTKDWDLDLLLFLEDPRSNKFRDRFFTRVAKPLWFAHEAVKHKAYADALEILDQCVATDWRRVAVEWVQRRIARQDAKVKA